MENFERCQRLEAPFRQFVEGVVSQVEFLQSGQANEDAFSHLSDPIERQVQISQVGHEGKIAVFQLQFTSAVLVAAVAARIATKTEPLELRKDHDSRRDVFESVVGQIEPHKKWHQVERSVLDADDSARTQVQVANARHQREHFGAQSWQSVLGQIQFFDVRMRQSFEHLSGWTSGEPQLRQIQRFESTIFHRMDQVTQIVFRHCILAENEPFQILEMHESLRANIPEITIAQFQRLQRRVAHQGKIGLVHST